jgi:hypothetical protein
MVRNKGVVFIGRQEDVARVTERIEHGGVLLVGPRRIGKTSLLKHICATPPTDLFALRVNLEGLEDVAGAVERIGEALIDNKLVTEKLAEKLGGFSLNIKGVQVERKANKVDDDPFEALETMLEDAIGKLEAHQRLALFLDEVPWWLDALRRMRSDDGDDDTQRRVTADARARQALAQLRYLRQRDDLADRLRMVFTGSVGISTLAGLLQSSDAIRDLSHYELKPMADSDGAALFDYELTLRNVDCDRDAADAAHALAGGSPHWIKQLAQLAAEQPRDGAKVGRDAVDRAVEALLAPRMRHLFDDEGNAHLHRRHGADARAMKRVLSLASGSDQGLSKTRLLSVAIEGGVQTRAEAERIVWSLVDEFYLEPDSDRLRFLNPLFRRWWERYGASA